MTPHPHTAPPQPWQNANNFPPSKQRHNSAPYPSGAPAYQHVRTEPYSNGNPEPYPDGNVDGNDDPLSPAPPEVKNEFGFLEEDFDGECYFLRHPDEIELDFSLGTIAWYPATFTQLALPSTFKEAELEVIAPRKPHSQGETSVSDYYIRELREETLLSVRQTNEWDKIKYDPIFKEFDPVRFIPLSKASLLAKYKDRQDSSWTLHDPSPTPEPSDRGVPSRKPSVNARDDDGDLIIDHDDSDEESEQDDVLGNLEQALHQNGVSRPGRHSRAGSNASISSQSAKPKPLIPVRDMNQEDRLAALGVTGEPKVVYTMPGPAIGAPPPQREGSVSHHSRQSSVASSRSDVQAPWPPPPPPGQPPGHNYHRRNNSQSERYELGNVGRPNSSTSQRTAPGSDFGDTNEEQTPRPKFNRTDSRKRAYEEDGGGAYGGGHDDADVTPKPQRYKQQRVNDAYSRRW